MIDYKYNELLREILDEGKQKTDRTGTGTLSIFDAKIKLDMSNGLPLLTCKKVFVRGIITELLWFLSGDTNIKPLLENGNKIWVGDAYKKFLKESVPHDHQETKEEFINKILTDTRFAEKWGELGPVYGKQWVDLGGTESAHITDERNDEGYLKIIKVKKQGINQIQNCIDMLKTNPDSRRIMVNSWNVSQLPDMTLPPCHFAFQFYTEELTMTEKEEWCKHNTNHMDCPMRRLHLKWHQRSVDSFLGLPFNIASYAFLLHMVAQQVNMIPGTLIGDLTNVHIYNNHIDQVKEQLNREPRKSPKLVLNKAKDLFSYKLDDFKIEGYNPHPVIRGELSN
jgi:thymidylate synthase